MFSMTSVFNSPLRIIKFLGAVLLIAAMGGYVLYQANDLLNGPSVTLSVPENGASVKHALVTVSGNAANVSFLHLNGRQIYVDSSGKFTEQLLLSEGYNIIEVSAEGRFGKTVSERHEIVFVEPRDVRADGTTTPALTQNP